MSNLANKVAFVTGGSRGIGAAIVKRLAADGAHVAFTYVSATDKALALATTIEEAGGTALPIQADSGDAAAIAAAIETAVQRLGGLDIIVNNAGVSVFSPVDHAEDTLDVVARLHAINVTGVAAAVRTASKYLGDGGRVINIGSSFADRVAFAGFADYAATKAALAAYARGWAWDLGKKGITVNTIQPGPTDTDMNPDNSDFATTIKAGLALGRYASPDEIAAVVSFVASPDASFVTGATINVDGGQNA
ncbi:SDR family NAD(P)-dependent oxidoreductase [Chitinophaga japonensis]|uniref:3-oxoacyl-[acyl-carrier protein] reductase n=1 Tax=Chitinophaga japonensis TaxID=104662 RepID=A0A562TD10_CHIJA|nr:SDR family oxidoreductase [Chitinophaga japonensis]TWI91447.1 3-oxoacyl-[acyl-carrier protein] reductase [Chitinophaga japonensis]